MCVSGGDKVRSFVSIIEGDLFLITKKNGKAHHFPSHFSQSRPMARNEMVSHAKLVPL